MKGNQPKKIRKTTGIDWSLVPKPVVGYFEDTEKHYLVVGNIRFEYVENKSFAGGWYYDMDKKLIEKDGRFFLQAKYVYKVGPKPEKNVVWIAGQPELPCMQTIPGTDHYWPVSKLPF